MKIRNQKGLTLLGFIIVLSFALFVAYLGMKIVPIYIDYYGVVDAMDEMASTKGNANRSPQDLRRILRAKLYTNYSDALEDREIKISRTEGVILKVKYDRRKSILGNLDVIVTFERSVVLPR